MQNKVTLVNPMNGKIHSIKFTFSWSRFFFPYWGAFKSRNVKLFIFHLLLWWVPLINVFFGAKGWKPMITSLIQHGYKPASPMDSQKLVQLGFTQFNNNNFGNPNHNGHVHTDAFGNPINNF